MCQDDAVLDCLIGQYSRPSESGHLLCGESLPLVYCPEYNITFGGIERLHPFDTGKWGRVVRFVADSIRPADQVVPHSLQILHSSPHRTVDVTSNQMGPSVTRICF